MGDLTSTHLGSTAGVAGTGGADGVSLATKGGEVGVVGMTMASVGVAATPGMTLPLEILKDGGIGVAVGIPLRTVSSKSALFRVNSAISV